MMPSTRRRFTAWVVFQGSDHRRFWRIFTRRGWRHCFVILPVYYPEPGLAAIKYAQVFEPKMNYLASDVIFKAPRDLVQEALDNGATAVIKYSVDTINLPFYIPRGVISCVSIIKCLLGIQAYFVVTPKQFARWLIRNGGEMVKGD